LFAYNVLGGDDAARQTLWAWAIGSLTPIVGVMLWGLGSERRDPLAFLVDGDRNRYSLSKLQIGVWTALITGAISAAAVANLANLPDGASASTAFNITIPEEVWALLGISTAGFVGSSVVKSQKRSSAAVPDGTEAATEVTGAGERRFTVRGAHAIADAPELADLVQAEGSSGPTDIDMGKVQMLIFTVVVMFAYVMVLVETFESGVTMVGTTPDGESAARMLVLSSFPAINGSLATLLAISHAGYLVNKSASTTAAPKEDETE